MKKRYFCLPPKGTLEPNDENDPLDYYYHPLIGFLYRRRIEQALSLLSPPYRLALEIGYGSGVMLPALASICNQVFGIDIKSDPRKTERNLERMGVRVSLVSGDVLAADFPENNFDLIVAISIIEHIKDLRPLLDKIFMLLRPGGYFLVGMPRVDNLMRAIFRFIGFKNIEAHHVTDYKRFLKYSSGKFELIKIARMPFWAPAFMSLYFNMLLRKGGKDSV